MENGVIKLLKRLRAEHQYGFIFYPSENIQRDVIESLNYSASIIKAISYLV